MEVYSSGGNFQLELPSGGQEGDWKLWEIPPHSTKPIIRVRFYGKQPGNHTAYVRIKVSGNDPSLQVEKMLVVPIEIEINNETGIYSEIPLLDFGMVGTNDDRTIYAFNLQNSGKEFIDIRSWGIQTLQGDAQNEEIASAISLDIQRTSESGNSNDYLSVLVDWSKFRESSYINGTIYVTTGMFHQDNTISSDHRQVKHEYVYRIPFYGQILKGGLEYQTDNLNFLSSDKKLFDSSRHFILKNKFNVPLSITNITVPDLCSQHFQIIGFQPTLLQPGVPVKLLEILPIQNASAPIKTWKSTLNTYFRLITNISNYDIPVLSYNGILKRLVPLDTAVISQPITQIDEKQLNFGTLPISKSSDLLLALINDNPIPISISNWKGSITSGTGAASIAVTMRGCSKFTLDNLMFCSKIKPGEWVIFEVAVYSNVVGSFSGKFVVKTDFEEIVTPVKFSTAMGRLELKKDFLIFNDCFPVSNFGIINTL